MMADSWSRRHTGPNSGFWGGLVLLVAFGCHRAPVAAPPEPAAGPPPDSTETPDLTALPVPDLATAAAEDSAADAAALEALRALEFRGLNKGTEHVGGTLSTDPDAVSDLILADGDPRGGTASASGPMYDIEVDAFASHRRVQYYIDFFLGNSRERFTIWLGRLNRYEGMIRDRFRRYGLPQDLVYLALIESGYSNTAVSRANAVGMWQFIRSTGRQYGLRINTWVDDRRDPFKATDAAARHLLDLKEQFGSWYLAAAAYNGGAGRVSRGLRRIGAEELSDSTFFDLSADRYIRRETRDYVPKLIAATLLAKEPRGYGFHSVPRIDPLVFDEITVPDQTGLDVIALLADTTTRAIAELNPHFYRGATPPGARATIRVPRGSGAVVARRYADLPESERVNLIEHTVRRGETMGEIAIRYGVSLRLLQAHNPRVRPRRMRIGQRLIIPLSATSRARAAQPVAPPARSEAPRRRPESEVRLPRTGARTHTVRWGDSLWLISQRYGVRISELRAWNGIAEGATELRPGQILWLRPPN